MQISHISTAVPDQEYTTEELLEVFPCRLPDGVRRNVFNLGVSKRYLINHDELKARREIVMKEKPLVDLCTRACQNAIKGADLLTKNIRHFVVTYDASPFLSPGLSQLLVRKLELSPYVNRINIQGEASTAFPKALQVARNCLSLHQKDNVLLCISGANSYWFSNQVRGIKQVMEISQINAIKNQKERRTKLREWIATMQFFLFGDGVVAAILTGEGGGIDVGRIIDVTNIRQEDVLAGYARLTAIGEPFTFGFQSDLDRKIPELGLKYSSIILKKLLGKDHTQVKKTVKKWAVHTGSEKILHLMAQHHEIRPDAIKESQEILKQYANLAGASLPFILERILSTGSASNGDILLMLGYGWGFSASAGLLRRKEGNS